MTRKQLEEQYKAEIVVNPEGRSGFKKCIGEVQTIEVPLWMTSA
jgi:hypothetical protein